VGGFAQKLETEKGGNPSADRDFCHETLKAHASKTPKAKKAGASGGGDLVAIFVTPPAFSPFLDLCFFIETSCSPPRAEHFLIEKMAVLTQTGDQL